MGRININFHVTQALVFSTPNIKADAIPAKDLAMALLALPGNTYITGCVTGILNPNALYTENTVEAENDQLADGTDVTVKYARHVVVVNGQMQQFNTFDGIHIAQPQSSATFAHSAPGGLAGLPTLPPPIAGVLGPCRSSHDWVTYNSGLSSYEYCKSCGVKK